MTWDRDGLCLEHYASGVDISMKVHRDEIDTIRECLDQIEEVYEESDE